MIASFNAELLKMRKRWANWILVSTFLLMVVAFSYVVSFIILSNPPPRFDSPVPASVLKTTTYPENLVPTLLSSVTSIGAAIMLILGGLSTASEYGWLTVQTILVQRPGRLAVLFGKLVALALVSLLVSVLLFLAGAISSAILVSLDHGAMTWPPLGDIARGFAATWLILAVWTAFGMLLGVAFRSTAAAIGGGLVYLFVAEALLGQLLRNTAGVKEVLRFLPGINASGLTAFFKLTFANPRDQAPLVSATRGTLTLAVYLLAFVVTAALIFRRRDVGA